MSWWDHSASSECPPPGENVLLVIVLAPAVGSNAFSWPSHTHQNQPGCRAQRRSLVRLACCFLSPLCKGTVAITVAHTFIATMATPRKQTELPSAVVQGKGEKGNPGYGSQSEEQRGAPSPEPGLCLPEHVQAKLSRVGVPWTDSCLHDALPRVGKRFREQLASCVQKRPVHPGAESTCGAAILGMILQGHPDMPPKPPPLSLRCHHPLPNTPSFKPTRSSPLAAW